MIQGQPPSSRRRLVTAAVAILAAGGLLLAPLDNSYRALWYGEVMDALHVPLFACLTWALGWLANGRSPWLPIVAAAALVCGSELIQPLVGRSASLRDVAYGGFGVAIGGVLLQRRPRVAQRVALAALLAAWPLWQTVPVTLDALLAWRGFPVLAAFEHPLETQRWWLQGARMTIEPEGVARFDFEPNQQGSSAILFPVVRDWTGYETLEIDFWFDGEPLLFLISVRDGKKLPPELPRFDLWKRYPAGHHQVRIPLAELARGGNFPPIELDRVQSLHLVAYSDQPRTVHVCRIALCGQPPVSQDQP